MGRCRRIGIAIDFSVGHYLGDLTAQPIRQVIGIFHRIELHQAFGPLHVIRRYRADIVADDFFRPGAHRFPPLRVFSNLNSAERACASKPSPRARVAASFPSFCAPLRETEMMLERF